MLIKWLTFKQSTIKARDSVGQQFRPFLVRREEKEKAATLEDSVYRFSHHLLRSPTPLEMWVRKDWQGAGFLHEVQNGL